MRESPNNLAWKKSLPFIHSRIWYLSYRRRVVCAPRRAPRTDSRGPGATPRRWKISCAHYCACAHPGRADWAGWAALAGRGSCGCGWAWACGRRHPRGRGGWACRPGRRRGRRPGRSGGPPPGEMRKLKLFNSRHPNNLNMILAVLS